MFVKEAIREQRMSICKACEFFTEKGTCGKRHWMKDGMIYHGDFITYNGQEYELCGCDMTLKTRFKPMGCPIGKWLPQGMSVEETCEIKAFIEEVKVGNKLDNQQLQQLFKYYNLASGEKLTVSTCVPCVKKILGEMERVFKNVMCPKC